MICNEPRSLAAAQRKNPPRMAAGGFQAKQITLTSAPWLTGPVNRSADFLSTDGPVLSRALDPARRFVLAEAGTHTPCPVVLAVRRMPFVSRKAKGFWVPAQGRDDVWRTS
jgi:hypothetical protein